MSYGFTSIPSSISSLQSRIRNASGFAQGMCQYWITFDEGYWNDPIPVTAKMFEKAQGFTPPTRYRKLSERLK
jgi:hypothetical protein